MSSKVKQVNSRKDSFLISNFSKAPTSEVPSLHHSYSHAHNHSESLAFETIEADIRTLLNQPLSERAQQFYDENISGQTTATLESTKPWLKDANYFQNVHLSSLALLKMTVHARSGGSIEVMGMLTGKIVKNGIVVMDVYPLPVEGTETRVNAQAEGYEFMVQYLESLKKTGRYENIVGWYHSHPGYGCWLSGIDVSTQSLNQTFQDPYLAIVVDPERTISQGKVEIGAFRTYSDEYVRNNTNLSNNNVIGGASLGLSPIVKKDTISKKSKSDKIVADIPEDKVKDFGLHSSKYYSLSIEIFRSNMDHMILQNLWSKFWINNLLGEENEDIDPIKKEEMILKNLTRLSARLELLKKTDIKQDSNQRPRRPRFTSAFQSQLSSQLSPFTKANLISKFKGKAGSDSDETDSEMNDADSDADSIRQDDDEDKPRAILKDVGFGVDRFEIHRRTKFSPVRTFLPIRYDNQKVVVSNEDEGNTNKDLTEKTASGSSKPYTSGGAEAGRNLTSLKLQEILFLNE